MLHRSLLPLTLAISAISGSIAHAEVDSNQELQVLKQRIAVLERKQELAQEDAEKAAQSNAVVVASDSQGFRIRNAKGDFQLRVGGLLHVDRRTFLDDSTELQRNSKPATTSIADSFVLRRVRLDIRGNFGSLIDYRLTPEFAGSTGTGDSASLIDAYVDVKFAPYANVRVGRQKSPQGLERLQSANYLHFLERGYANELVANRDLGVQLFGKVLDNKLEYNLGVFNGAPDGRDASQYDDSRVELVARVFATPFSDQFGAISGLSFGVAGSQTTNRIADNAAQTTSNFNNTLPRYRSHGQQTIFAYRSNATPDSTNTAIGTDHSRIVPQLSYYYNNVGLLAEYVISKQDVSLNGNKRSLENKAYTVTTSYVLTGEDSSYSGVKPKKPFKVGGDGWGAVELVARASGLDIDNDAFKTFQVAGKDVAGSELADPFTQVSKATGYGIGVNWWLNNNLKLSTDYNRTEFEGGRRDLSGKLADRQTEQALFSRLTVSF
jgi:phosphate-selective porin OprO/OprP